MSGDISAQTCNQCPTPAKTRAFGVGFTTGPGGPFYEVNSGWWNVWLALVLSVVYFVYAYKRVAPGNMFVNTFSHTLFIIFFASIVEMGVSANLCQWERGGVGVKRQC